MRSPEPNPASPVPGLVPGGPPGHGSGDSSSVLHIEALLTKVGPGLRVLLPLGAEQCLRAEVRLSARAAAAERSAAQTKPRQSA
jgi:hypothetical protein